MKSKTNVIIVSLLASLSVGLLSCDVADSDKEWGIALVYMPQAVIQSGGTNNNYYVPWGTSDYNKNYVIDRSGGRDRIDVVLGVYRSGLQALNAYRVDIIARPDTVTYLMDEKMLTEAVLLPEESYELPGSISVPDREREAIFYLSIDRQKLLEEFPSFSGQRLVMAVAIANPTRYELNPDLSTTIVIVDDWETLE